MTATIIAPPSTRGIISWSTFLDDEAILVFGSNRPGGVHGKGAALEAARHYGAQNGVAEGLTGRSYAIPTKGERLGDRKDFELLPLEEVAGGAERFLKFAASQPNLRFQLTRIACGLAGFEDEQIAPLFEKAPSNVLVPGSWLAAAGRLEYPRVVVAGSRSFADAIDPSPHRLHLHHCLDRVRSKIGPIEVVSGTARGPDKWGEEWADSQNGTKARFPARWEDNRFLRAAGHRRNRQMAWYGSHLVTLYDGVSDGTRTMMEVAAEEKQKVWKIVAQP